jgi:hypothetical protein
MGDVTYLPRIPRLGFGAFTLDAGGVVHRHLGQPEIFVVHDLARDWSCRHFRTEREARLLAARRWPRERWVTAAMIGVNLERHRVLGEMAAERQNADPAAGLV